MTNESVQKYCSHDVLSQHVLYALLAYITCNLFCIYRLLCVGFCFLSGAYTSREIGWEDPIVC